tara:strand:- start:573 stop:845 length:273 start_codon:yes stop_codon:yes gene_type:complete
MMLPSYRGMVDRDGIYSIREVSYDSEETMTSFSIDPAMAEANSEAELISILALMIESLQQPFLIEGDFIPEKGNGELEFSFIRDEKSKYH